MVDLIPMLIVLFLISMFAGWHVASIGTLYIHARPDLGYWIIRSRMFGFMDKDISIHYCEIDAQRQLGRMILERDR